MKIVVASFLVNNKAETIISNINKITLGYISQRGVTFWEPESIAYYNLGIQYSLLDKTTHVGRSTTNPL